MIFLCRSLTNITCESLLISVQGIEELDLIFLAAKNPLVKNFLCVCVCTSACTCESAAQCFLLAFLTGSWCWVQLRTRKRPFLSSVNHLRQREKNKKRRGEGRGQRAWAAALIQPSAIFPSSPCLHFLHRLTIPALFSHSLCNFHPSYTPELRGSVGLQRGHELCKRTRETQKVNEAGRCGGQSCRFFWFSLSSMRLCISEHLKHLH